MNAAILLTPQAEPCREGNFRSAGHPEEVPLAWMPDLDS